MMTDKELNIEDLNDEEVDKAVDFLRNTADMGARFRAERQYLDNYSKSLKSILMKQFSDLPISAQEREAYAHPKYIAHLKAVKDAVFNDEKHRFLRSGAEVKISAWQSKQANIRALKI